MRYVVITGGTEQHRATPSGTGAGYTMPDGLASLEEVRDLMALVSGVAIPTPPAGVTDSIPAGGRPHSLHGDVMPPLITGWRTPMYAVYEHASSDQIVAQQLAGNTPFESLQFRAQPHNYKGSNGGVGGVISVRDGGVQVTPQTSPRLAWEQLTLGIAPDDPTAAAAQMRKLARQKSVLDLVLDHGNHVKNRVASADAKRLEKYMDELRALELRLDSLGGTPTGACSAVADPGADPTQENHPSINQGGTTGYSGENERSEVFVDLIHMALQCDLSRVATFQSTIEQCFMSTAPLWGVEYEVHDLTHVDFTGRDEIWASVISWQAGFFARLVSKLAEPDPGGSSDPLLESTVVVYTNTGGQTGHGSYDMTMAVAGPSDVIRRGEHIRAVGAMPCHVFQTAMEAVGVVQDFGEVPGTVDALLL